MNVPLLDLKAQFATLRSELLPAIETVFENQAFILGREVELLEKEIAEYCGVPHAIACASGSDALLLALMALDIKPGDEVITTPYTFFATAGSISRLGAIPVFVDIEPHTFNLDPTQLEQKITPRTRAIIPVHLFGQCADMDVINQIACAHDLPVIEDAAQAIGAEWKGKRAGSMGLIGCFSFYPTKNLGAAGDAGCLTTLDDGLAARLRALRVHGETTKYYHRYVGFNSRLDALQAVVLRIKLRHLDAWSTARAQNAHHYAELVAAHPGLADKVQLPTVLPDVRHIFNQFVIRATNRDALRNFLKEQSIGTEVYYPLSLHQQECFADLGYRTGDFPESERAALETLALPIYPELTAEMRHYVVENLVDFYADMH